MKYIYLYQNENEYNADSTRVLPAVSYSEQEMITHYSPDDGSNPDPDEPDPDEPVHPSGDYITFADPVVEQIITDAYGTNGKITYGQAAAVTEFVSGEDSASNPFFGNESITSFDELQYFTGLTSIGNYTFSECTFLKSITLPNSVTSIGDLAFFRCTLLSNINIPINLQEIGFGAFNECISLNINLNLPNSLTTISQNAFNTCKKIKSITLGNSLISIGDGAFYGCKDAIGDIIIPNTVTEMGTSVFSDCHSITSVSISSGLKKINNLSFAACKSLETVYIPNSISLIGESAFGGYRTNLTSFYIQATTPPTLLSNALPNNENCTFYVPAESVDAYKAADGWSQFADRISPITE